MAGRRVLVVDDDTVLARTVGRLLGGEGYEVTIVNEAEAARNTLAAQRFDGVILDFHLDLTTATELLDSLGAVRANLPAVLIMSGKITVAETVAVMKLGVGDVIEKPFEAVDLCNRLRRLIRIAEAARTVPIPLSPAKARATRMRLGMFDVTGMIAQGGMGGVYRGKNQVTGKDVAIKILDPQWAGRPDMADRLLGELEVSRRVDHPNLVKVLSAERTGDGLPYLVLELVDGQSLTTIIDQRGWLAPGLAAAVGAQLAAALAALHAGGIVHADLKPDNVLVLPEARPDGHPRVKLLDFGVAHFLDRPRDESFAWGTPQYLSPEQWAGRPRTASDVYGLGCVLTELVLGKPPFDGPIEDLAHAHIWDVPPPLSTARPEVAVLDNVVARMLKKRWPDRPTMDHVASELEAIAERGRDQ